MPPKILLDYSAFAIARFRQIAAPPQVIPSPNNIMIIAAVDISGLRSQGVIVKPGCQYDSDDRHCSQHAPAQPQDFIIRVTTVIGGEVCHQVADYQYRKLACAEITNAEFPPPTNRKI